MHQQKNPSLPLLYADLMALLEVWNMEGQCEIHLASPLEPEQSGVPVHLYTMLSLEPEQKQSED